jgi:hypothetical protein
MLNVKFLILGSEGTSQNCPKSLFWDDFFPLKTDFKVLQLLNGLRQRQKLFSVGYNFSKD